ncbi:hypothetical protein IMZ48_02660, partial [Candidatus Bathyarchaeota archaeon]|nr:hypothetical protein [Candidatus Bathyarchaeota archaeon]
MSNVIILSSSPAVSGARGSLGLARSSSPDFPSLEELVSQENSANTRPLRTLAKGTRSRPTEGVRGNGREKERAAVTAHGPLQVDDDPADASLIEMPPPGFATGAQSANAKSKKAPAGGKAKATRAKRDGATSTRETSANAPLRESTADEAAAPKPPKPRRKQTGAVSRHFKTQPEPARPKTPAENPDDPLNIENALHRRGDWTPPPKDTVKEFGSRSSDIIELLSSTAKEQGAGIS